MSVVPMVLIPQIIFAGMVFELEGMARSVSWFTVSRWALEGLGATANLSALAERSAVPAELSFSYEHSAGYLLGRWLVLLLWAIGLTAITCWLQRRKDVL